MHCRETIRRLNARAVVSATAKISRSCLTIQRGLWEAEAIDIEIAGARDVARVMPHKAKQLRVAEKYFIEARARALSLQEEALHLGEVLDAYAVLLEHNEARRSLLEGRLLVAEAIYDAQLADEIRPDYRDAVEQHGELIAGQAEIRNLLDKYSGEYSKGCQMKAVIGENEMATPKCALAFGLGGA
jgi:hypothetical protein